MSFDSDSPQATAQFARAFAAVLRGGDIVSLEGDLGTGKTFFTAAIALALGVTVPVSSPTFTLQKIYETQTGAIRRIIHYDFYRIAQAGELAEIGFEAPEPDTVAIAEWGDRFPQVCGEKALRVCLEYSGVHGRHIRITIPNSRPLPQFNPNDITESQNNGDS
ncbi:MAG: tRNA (adenosine(37)-N6)-threonylcarbamoyltransferase complex ATPase subunit type 1 TsaE [bacterium]|nr:tRNA (adenosine(37)-N6)-threonylcarbamoyltransferase complex ATPase subunit type 1 TsaE [Candidatus Sumerlaeota bacterium]